MLVLNAVVNFCSFPFSKSILVHKINPYLDIIIIVMLVVEQNVAQRSRYWPLNRTGPGVASSRCAPSCPAGPFACSWTWSCCRALTFRR